MTEDEAKTKWCPMERRAYVEDSPPAHNLMDDCEGDEIRSTCIGSECMMWRWRTVRRAQHPETQEGYCGLAGKP